MKVKTSELSGKALDYAVAKCEGGTDFAFDGITWGFRLDGRTKVLAKDWVASMMFCPSTEWGHGGPIIERERISIRQWVNVPIVHAYMPTDDAPWSSDGESPLVAAMRCYVASRMGEEVEVPDFLE